MTPLLFYFNVLPEFESLLVSCSCSLLILAVLLEAEVIPKCRFSWVLEPVLSYTEKSCIASYYKRFSKIPNNHKINTSFVRFSNYSVNMMIRQKFKFLPSASTKEESSSTCGCWKLLAAAAMRSLIGRCLPRTSNTWPPSVGILPPLLFVGIMERKRSSGFRLIFTEGFDRLF